MAKLCIFLLGGSSFPQCREQLMHGNIWCDTYCLRIGKTKTKCPTSAFKLKSNVPVWVWSAEQSMSEFIIAGNGRLAANYTSKLKTILRSQWGQKRSINYPETKTLPLCIIQRKINTLLRVKLHNLFFLLISKLLNRHFPMVNYSNKPWNCWLCKHTGVFGFILLGHFLYPNGY